MSAAPLATVLVVDDQPANLQLVGSQLAAAGFDVMPARSGAQALARIAARMPDLVLLDLLMPEMDGFELLERLRADPRLAALPVIVLTALQERELLVRAFAAGAVDYLTKPCVVEEMLARVRTHVELKRARDHLARIAREQSELTEIVAHDLKSPLSSIQFAAQMLQQRRELPAGRRDGLLQSIAESAAEALRFVQGFLARRAEEELPRRQRIEAIDLAALVKVRAARLADAAAAGGTRIELALAPDLPPAAGDPAAVANIVENLLSNALRYGASEHGIDAVLERGTPGFLRLRVLDRGPGIASADQSRLFRRFVRLGAGESTPGSSGLGLAIARQSAEQMGGRLWYEDRPGGGAQFALELPLAG